MEFTEDLVDQVPFVPLPKQRSFWNAVWARVKRCFFIGGIRSGKTVVGGWAFVLLALTYGERLIEAWNGAPVYFWFCSPSHDGCQRQHDEIEKVLNLVVGPENYSYKASKRWFELFDGRVRLCQRTADDPELLKGFTVEVIWLDEPGRTKRDSWRALLGRLADAKIGQILCTGTPKRAFSPWLNSEFKTNRKNPRYSWSFSRTQDNPELKREEVAQLEIDYPGEYGREELGGELLESWSGLIYPNFGEKHILESYVPGPLDTILCGIDWGWTDPFVCLWAAKRPNNQIVFFDEVYGSHLTVTDAKALLQKRTFETRVARRWYDPSRPDSATEFIRAGILCNASRQHKIMDGVRMVAARIDARTAEGEPMLMVTRACPNMINEFGAYARTPKDGVNAGENPDDFHNHTMDGGRYLIYNEDYGSGLLAVHHPGPAARKDGRIVCPEATFDPATGITWYNQEAVFDLSEILQGEKPCQTN